MVPGTYLFIINKCLVENKTCLFSDLEMCHVNEIQLFQQRNVCLCCQRHEQTVPSHE